LIATFILRQGTVYVPSLRAHQDNKSASDDGMERTFMGTNQVAGGKLLWRGMGRRTHQLGLVKEDWKKG
jgi:hypothetical protein